MLARGETYAAEGIHRRRNGDPFWVRGGAPSILPIRRAAPSELRDITDRKLAEESLREAKRCSAILDSANLMIIATDRDGRIVTANPACEKLLDGRRASLCARCRRIPSSIRAPSMSSVAFFADLG